MIKNVIFDMGDVLFHFDRDYYMDIAGVKDPADRKLLLQEMYLSPQWVMQDRGTLTLDEAEAIYKTRIPQRLHSAIHFIVHDWWNTLIPIPGMSDLVADIKARGYNLYLLTNAATDQVAYWPLVPGHEHFDGTVVSAEVKCIKPEREIFELICRKYELIPEECVFIDNNSSNVEGAMNIGMQGIVFFNDVDLLRTKLKDLDILK